jgi:hypothetical protein
LEGGLGGQSFDYEVIIAVWAVLIAVSLSINMDDEVDSYCRDLGKY